MVHALGLVLLKFTTAPIVHALTKVEEYENAVKYRRENMQQWWRPETLRQEQSHAFDPSANAKNAHKTAVNEPR